MGQSSLVGFTRGEGLCDLTAHYCWKAGPCDLTARINAPTTWSRRSKEPCGILKFSTGVVLWRRSTKHGSPVPYGDKKWSNLLVISLLALFYSFPQKNIILFLPHRERATCSETPEEKDETQEQKKKEDYHPKWSNSPYGTGLPCFVLLRRSTTPVENLSIPHGSLLLLDQVVGAFIREFKSQGPAFQQ